ncbi:short chain dehydrogenase [Streptomyces orinoci]|uniref:Short chain dehydrogenase n=1 Tax=Streptomyces orinoci TaxID=67339 RepID=A0ABV3JXQ0_STRON|nr:short chain dehydrogenase [Streptomyces orinoci]
MKVLVIGASGTVGSAVRALLLERGHEVVTVGRSGTADVIADMTDPGSVSRMYEQVTGLDAVVCAAGGAVFRPLPQLTAEDFEATFRGKALSQLELVRQGARHVAPQGSFTLISGVLTEEPIVAGAAVSAANGAVEAFARAAAIELAPQRVNVVSPTLVAESADAYGAFFPGIEPVPARRVALAYLRSLEGHATGQIYRVTTP